MYKVLHVVCFMFIFVLGGCSEKSKETTTTQQTEATQSTTKNDSTIANTNESNKHDESKKEQSQENKEEQQVVSSNEIRADFKEAMDIYDQFCDEYVAFMKEYKNDATNMKLIGKYSEMVKSLAEMEDDFSTWEQRDLNTKELQYYVDVQARVYQKMLEVAM